MIQILANLSWPDVPLKPIVLVPVGSTEQHGPHLPFDTDTVIATAVAEEVALELGNHAIVAPAIAYGSSGEHQSFRGTGSIGTEALQMMVVELVRSLSTWARSIIFVNGHGGNTAAISKAVFQMIVEQHDVAWVPCATEETDLHAGRTETSLMMCLRPGSVNVDRAVAGDARPLADIFPLLVNGGVASVSPSGVLGDPHGASAAEGDQLLEELAQDVLARIVWGQPDSRGMLTRAVAEVSG